MFLETDYLGLRLRNQLVASAGPISQTVSGVQSLADGGVGAVVLYSLFEEQIEHEEMATHKLLMYGAELSPEASGFFPEMQHYRTGPDQYLQLIQDAKKALSVPVIASLNGHTAGGWTGIARQLQDAGADVVTGSQAHQPQHVELHGGKPIFYGLGNLFFDQTWSPATRQSLIVRHYVYQGRLLSVEILPTTMDGDYQPTLAEGQERDEILRTVLPMR